ncbi:hypothetical protein C8F04DRAFT_1264948 [Mycena alexandri]|uniref:Uncharacterized protein n=1 Tax=Mycena alexandri TaxID=1745969 RepID=A0AAD6SL54_9AGAR|nr:hypothetical protein C8F04DRAFT_1264948 [Mycena alexandri]
MSQPTTTTINMKLPSMVAAVNPSHNIITMVLNTTHGPHKKDLLQFIRMFRMAHGTRIQTSGTKEEVALRIADTLAEFEKVGDTGAWEAAYDAWTDVKYSLFPNFKRNE